MSYAPFPLIWGPFGKPNTGPAFGIIQTDFGTYPTATGGSDVLNLVSADNTLYYFTGTALTDTVTLTINGFVTNSEFTQYKELIKEPTGFPNRTDSATSFDNSTRQFTIQPVTTSFDVYIRGHKFTKTTAQTITIPNLPGNHYIYFDINGSLQTTQVIDASIFQDNAFVAIIYWNTDISEQVYFAEERHGLVMDGSTHGYLHTVLGARFLSGFALQNFNVDGSGNLDSNAQFTSDSGSIRDEDLVIQGLAQSQIPILYRQGSQWRKKAADSFPVIYSGTAGYVGANGRLPYNLLTGSTWSLAEVPTNRFVMVHFFATNDVNNHVVGVQGTTAYIDITSARTAANVEISSLSGLPFAEFVAIGSVIFETANSYGNIPKARVRSTDTGGNYVDFRGTQPYTPAYGNASSHSLLSNLSNDDHLQYLTEARGDARYYTKAQIDANTIGNTFESVSKNLRQYDYVLNYTGSQLTSMVYTVPSVGTITKTFNYTGSQLVSIVLSGATPSGIDLTKTFTYSGTTLTGVTYA